MPKRLAFLALTLTIAIMAAMGARTAQAGTDVAFVVTDKSCTAQSGSAIGDFWLNNTGGNLPVIFAAVDNTDTVRYHGPVNIAQGELVANDFQSFTGCTLVQFKKLASEVFGTNKFAPMRVLKGI